MDSRQIIEFGRYLRRALERRAVIEHQLAKQFIDTVQLLEAGGTIQQSEGVLAHLEEAAKLRDIGLLVLEYLQIGKLAPKLLQCALAAGVMHFEPLIQSLLLLPGNQPDPVKVGGRRTTPLH